MPFIRLAHQNDIARIVEIHSESLPHDLLPLLGSRFLRGTFYPFVFAEAANAFIVVGGDEQVDAFAVFVLQASAFTKKLSARKTDLFIALASRIFLSPSIIFQILSVRQNQRMESQFSNDEICRFPEIYVAATHPDKQGKGIGTAVIQEGLKMLLARQNTGNCIVKTSSNRASNFYKKIGFVEIGSLLRGRRRFAIFLFKH